MLKVSRSISARTGTARTERMALRRAGQTKLGSATSSPSPIFRASRARCRAAVPELTATAPPTPISCGQRLFEMKDLFALGKLSGREDGSDGGNLLLVDGRTGMGDHLHQEISLYKS